MTIEYSNGEVIIKREPWGKKKIDRLWQRPPMTPDEELAEKLRVEAARNLAEARERRARERLYGRNK